jgi:hypothetical protein
MTRNKDRAANTQGFSSSNYAESDSSAGILVSKLRSLSPKPVLRKAQIVLTFLIKVEVLPVVSDQYAEDLRELLLLVVTFQNYRMSPYHAKI